MAEREGKGVTAFDEAGNSYALFDNQWVSFDSQSTVLEKVRDFQINNIRTSCYLDTICNLLIMRKFTSQMRFVISSGLAGAAAWSMDMDDFRGLCGTPFPILSTISTSLNGNICYLLTL